MQKNLLVDSNRRQYKMSIEPQLTALNLVE